MTTSIIVASVTAFWGLVVWFVKLLLLERYQFMDMIGGKPVPGPWVMIRLDRLTGEVHAFNWARVGENKTAFRLSWDGKTRRPGDSWLGGVEQNKRRLNLCGAHPSPFCWL